MPGGKEMKCSYLLDVSQYKAQIADIIQILIYSNIIFVMINWGFYVDKYSKEYELMVEL